MKALLSIVGWVVLIALLGNLKIKISINDDKEASL